MKMLLPKIHQWRHRLPNTRTLTSLHQNTYHTEPSIMSPSQQQQDPFDNLKVTQMMNSINTTVSNTTDLTKSRIQELCDTNRDTASFQLLEHLRLHGFHEAHNRFLLSISLRSCPDEQTCNALLSQLLSGYDPQYTLSSINALAGESVQSSVDNNKLILYLCEFGRLEEAHMVLYRMMEMRDGPSVVSYIALLNGYCKVRNLGAADKLFDEMLDWVARCNAHEEIGLWVLSALGDERPGFVPSLGNYNRLIDWLCKLGSLEEAHSVLYRMMGRRESPNVVSFNTLISGYCKIGDVEAAEKLLDEMSVCGVQKNGLTYTAFIRGFMKKLDFDNAESMMRKVWDVIEGETDLKLKNATFRSLLDCLCREELFDEVVKIAKDMPQGESVPEEFAYAQMIDSLCKFEGCEVAARIVNIMTKKGLPPSTASYNTIVLGLCKADDALKAFEVLLYAKEFGYIPSETTFSVLVRILCKEHDLFQAKEVLSLMLSKEGVEKIRIYNTFMKFLCTANSAPEIENLLVVMQNLECKPDITTLNTGLKGLCKMGKVDEALVIFEEMNKGTYCAPDIVSFTTIISGLMHMEKGDEAADLFLNVMPKKGFSPGIVTYNVVIRGLFKLGRCEDAMQAYNNMIENNIPANATTYTLVVEGLSESFQIDEAKKFFEEVVWPSGIHDNNVYTAILRGMCRLEEYDGAYDLLFELSDCGVGLDLANYNIMIAYACKQGFFEDAIEILEDMKRNRVSPDSDTWRVLGNCVKQRRTTGAVCFVNGFAETANF